MSQSVNKFARFSILLALGVLTAAAHAAQPASNDYPGVSGRATAPVEPYRPANDDFQKYQPNDTGLGPASLSETPPSLEYLQTIEKEDEPETPGFAVRVESQKEAALSYGARGGLAWRTFENRKRIQRYEDNLDRIYNFRALLINAPSNFFIEPPVISEAVDAIKVENGGTDAAVADKILKISSNARIVNAARDWRNYLEREWAQPEEPPNQLRPTTDEERKLWRANVAEGWKAGIEQADDILQSDLDRLNKDFVGMVRYRQLLTQAIVNQPFAVMQDRGVTGGGVEMRIGDRAVRLTGPVMLSPRAGSWISTPEIIHQTK